MLYQAERHLPLTEKEWDAGLAERTITDILDRCVANFSSSTFWPLPEEERDLQVATSVYLGAMGTLWAMEYLEDYAGREFPFDKSRLAEEVYRQYFLTDAVVFAGHGDAEGNVPSYWLGESGILLVMSKLVPERRESLWDRLYPLIEKNMKNPALEPLWGGTGTIIPALFRLEAGPDRKWIDLFVSHCQFMKDSIGRSERLDCQIWMQDLYGRKRRLVGAGHGFVGNMYPFLRGRKFLPENLADWVVGCSVETAIKTSVTEGRGCNWPGSIDNGSDVQAGYRVQWCHGAPGVIISLNSIPVGYSGEFDDLLLKAGELIWEAGPLTKGVGLCHGTDGNGYALLKLYTRTGDEKWLERARKFAMHAIEQVSGRYSLWEGDPGLACFLHACLVKDDRFPLLDVC